MGFEVLGQAVELEARRIATAFEVGEWSEPSSFLFESYAHYRGRCGDATIEWALLRTDLCLVFIRVGRSGDLNVSDCSEIADGGYQGWLYAPHPDFDEVMARGLCRLEFEMSTLPLLNQDPFSRPEVVELHPLSAHEKLELRLSMPREFWPQSWQKEEQ